MNIEKIDCSVLEYTLEGKTFYEVVVQKRDKFGKARKKQSRFTNSKKRITSKQGIAQVKERLQQEIRTFVEEKSTYTWQQWKNLCIHKMRKSGLKESTLKNYDGIVDRWKDPSWSDKFLTEVSREDVSEYFKAYLPKKGASDWTRRNLHKRIHRMFEMAVDDGEISKNPARGIKIKARSDDGVAFTPSEVKTLLSKAKLSNHPYYPHWVVALLTGLRNGELYALSYDKIDFDSNTILINEQFTSKDGLHPPKSGKPRTIDLGSELKTFLIDLKAKIGPQRAKLYKYEYRVEEVDEVIGGSKTGRKMNIYMGTKIPEVRDNLILPRIRSWQGGEQAKELREFCRKIGIREAKFHDLRATHITNLLSNGTSISKVMNQVGHSMMKTTDEYHRLAGVEIKGITENLGFSVPLEEDSEPDDNVINIFSKRASGSK